MSDEQNERFKYVNDHDPSQHDKVGRINKNQLNQYAAKISIMGIQGGLGWRTHDNLQAEQSIAKKEEISEQQNQKQVNVQFRDRRIRKLTNVNKHLLEQLKQLNDELTKRVNKQKFRVPKKSQKKHTTPKNQQSAKQLEGVKRQLQNAYRQIQYYKETVSLLKARQMPAADKHKVNQMSSKLKQKNEQIQKIQNQIKTQRGIKQMQVKELQKIQNEQLTQTIKKLQDQIKTCKHKLKQIKKTLVKRQELEKKQHMYLAELEILIKKKRNQDETNQTETYVQMGKKNTQLAEEQQLTQSQWRQIKAKLAVQKKKYQEYGKKITYQNYMKSKLSKNYEELQLKYKEKAKVLDKLKSKLNEVNKLARLVPKPEILERVDLKMEKLKDIISRQNTIQMAQHNRAQLRAQSEDTRQFKKWELEHAQSHNDIDNHEESQLKYKPKNSQSSNQDTHRLRPEQYLNLNPHEVKS